MSVYPSGLDSFTPVVSGVSEIRSADINDLQESISAVQSTIGISGNYNFVKGVAYETFPFVCDNNSVITGTFTCQNNVLAPVSLVLLNITDTYPLAGLGGYSTVLSQQEIDQLISDGMDPSYYNTYPSFSGNTLNIYYAVAGILGKNLRLAFRYLF